MGTRERAQVYSALLVVRRRRAGGGGERRRRRRENALDYRDRVALRAPEAPINGDVGE